MDSRQSYDADPVMAVLSKLKHQFGLSPGLSPPAAQLLAANALGYDWETGLQEQLYPALLQSPMVLAGKASDPDLPSTREALSGPHAEEFWKAMDKEIRELEAKGSWEIVDRSSIPAGMKAVPGTWALRIKRLPCGTLSKFKARWCCRGDLMEIDGPTYSPLVGWPTVRAALLLAATHGWKSRQVDFSNAFLQSDQPADQPLYLELPQYYRPVGFEDRDVVLRMKKSIYGQVNSPKLFYEHLCAGMKQLGFEATAADPCLFIHKQHQLMVLSYCDDQIWLSPDNNLIEEYVGKLQALKYDLTLEQDVDLFGFLGINFKMDGSNIELTQTGLIDKVIAYTGMQDASAKDTPASASPLGTDKDGDPFDETWSYAAAVGMLLYVSSNTRPDIQFAVHQVARFSHCPKQSHAKAVKRIIRYLVGTRDKGIRFLPNLKEGLNCYVDADFAGLFGYEDDQDPTSVKSRTGFTLTLFGCPIIWSSKLQTDITLSSTAAEYVAFSMAMRELLPMRALLQEISTKLDLQYVSTSLVRSTVFEDNQGCLSLVNVPKMSTRNKYLALKYHFFRSHIGEDKGIVARYIPTTEQKADIFTKGLPSSQFQAIRKLLIGW
jgi:histone deacetylase 1/2